MNVTIRDYRKDDWPQICQVHDLARPVELSAIMPRDVVLPMTHAAPLEGFFECQTFVACTDDSQTQIIGFISIRSPEINWCYVAPEFHRRGIGRQLVQRILPILGKDAFVLTIAENPAATDFYKSLGFIIAAQFPGEAQGYRCQCVRLTLPHSAHRHRPPNPTLTSLRLAGFTEQSPGKPFLDPDGVYRWK